MIISGLRLSERLRIIRRGFVARCELWRADTSVAKEQGYDKPAASYEEMIENWQLVDTLLDQEEVLEYYAAYICTAEVNRLLTYEHKPKVKS